MKCTRRWCKHASSRIHVSFFLGSKGVNHEVMMFFSIFETCQTCQRQPVMVLDLCVQIVYICELLPSFTSSTWASQGRKFHSIKTCSAKERTSLWTTSWKNATALSCDFFFFSSLALGISFSCQRFLLTLDISFFGNMFLLTALDFSFSWHLLFFDSWL